MITRFNLTLDARGRIRTARNNGDDRGLSLRNRRVWYADEPPATPVTPPTPDKPAPEPEKSGAADSDAGDKIPDWVKDPAKAYEEIKERRAEAAVNRKEAATLKKRLDDLEKTKTEDEEKKLTEEKRWQELAEKREREKLEMKAEYEGKLRASLQTLIGKEFKLPDSLIARLQGATEEELRADAEQLAKDLGLDKPAEPKPETPAAGTPAPETQPARGQTTTTAVPGGQPVGRTDVDRRKEYFGGANTSPIFQGGGVVHHGKGDPE